MVRLFKRLASLLVCTVNLTNSQFSSDENWELSIDQILSRPSSSARLFISTVSTSFLDATFLYEFDPLPFPAADPAPRLSQCDSFPENTPSPGQCVAVREVSGALPEHPCGYRLAQTHPVLKGCLRVSLRPRHLHVEFDGGLRNGCNRSHACAQWSEARRSAFRGLHRNGMPAAKPARKRPPARLRHLRDFPRCVKRERTPGGCSGRRTSLALLHHSTPCAGLDRDPLVPDVARQTPSEMVTNITAGNTSTSSLKELWAIQIRLAPVVVGIDPLKRRKT